MYPAWHCVPEGGAGALGTQGCAQILAQARAQLGLLGWADYDGWWLAAGTGTTLVGLAQAEAGAHQVHGAMAVPAGQGVEAETARLAPETYRLYDASRGGFAKADPALLAFIAASEAESGVPLEPLYTGKALLALHAQVEAGAFAAGTRLIFVHTGGLQGRRGFV